MANTPTHVVVNVALPPELKKNLEEMLMAQYRDGVRDGVKIVRDTLNSTDNRVQSKPELVSGIDFAKSVIEGCLTLATEEAEKASQE